jgi:hypothetical protein
VTPFDAEGAVMMWADRAASSSQDLTHVSLMHGWVPTAVQIVTAAVLILAVGWRTRRWRLVALPVLAIFGAALAVVASWYVGRAGMTGDSAPALLLIWIALTGFAVGTAVAGWRGSRWRRRALSILAVPLSVLCSALSLNTLGRLSANRRIRLESIHRRTAARSNRPRHGQRDATGRCGARQRRCRSGEHQCRGVEVRPSW